MILCSTGAFFDPGGWDADTIAEVGPQLPVDGLEVLVTNRLVGRLAAMSDVLVRLELRFPVVHAPKRLGAELPGDEARPQLEETASFAKSIGARTVVLHLWDLPDSDADFDTRLRALDVASRVLDDHGLDLAVETIPCTVATPLTNVRRVLEYQPKAKVALDTEFLAHHAELESALAADWLWSDGTVAHIHVKDFATSLFDDTGKRRYLDPGMGAIDFVGFFDALEARRYAGTVSLESPARTQDKRPDVDRLCRNLGRMSHSPWRFAQ